MQEERTRAMPHNIIMQERNLLTVSGVEDVDNFDENLVTVITPLGILAVAGENLHINKLSTESGELTVTGDIYQLTYSQDEKSSGGFFSRMFR